jgi:lysophospholipase L1-like esterase
VKWSPCTSAAVAAALSLIATVHTASADGGPILTGSLQANDRVAICGDSITEQKNYSALIEEYLLACQPAPAIQAAQFGWGGETTWGFAPRMNQDVLWFKPTVATVNYGMNDGGYKPVDEKRLADYRARTKEIIDQLKAAGCRLIVIGGPGAVDTDRFRTYIAQGHDAAVMYNKTLATFGDAAREVAQQNGVAFADLHAVMADAMTRFKQLHPDKSFVGNDGIHPENVGHAVMAYAFLNAMGCDGDIGTVTLDLAANTADATAGHKVVSMADGTATIESTRWPFYVARTNDALSIGSAMDLVPFMKDLNRYTLVVRNGPPGRRLKVTWGEAGPAAGAKPTLVTKTFDAADLANGINLADSFPTTPFEHAWVRFDGAVHAQQEFETPLNKQWLHNRPKWSADVPSAADTFRDLSTAAERFDAQLRKASSAVVVPVTHSIHVEAE